MNSFTTVIYTFKVSKHIIIGQSTNINVFSWLLFFFKLRERESGIQNLGIKEKCPKVTYLIFRRGSTGESFFFHRLIDFILFFYTGLKNLGSFVSQVFFCLQPGILAMVRLPATNPTQKLTFFLSISADGGGVPLPFWGPSQSFGFSLPPLPVSGDLRLLSTNTWSPLCDPHSFLTVTLWRFDTVNSNTGG